MKKALLSFLLISHFCFSQEIDFNKSPQLQTRATYTTEVIPDKITLSIKLSEGNTKGKVPVEELENRMKKVLAANNIDIKTQLTLTDLSSNFKDYILKKTDIQKSKNYQLELFDAITAGKILKELENQEISNVQLLKTEFSKLEELKIELKGKAILKAKKQAEEMVKNLNQKLGSAIFISDLQINQQYVNPNVLNGRVAGLTIRGLNSTGFVNNETDLEIEFDNIKVDATVTVYFKLE